MLVSMQSEDELAETVDKDLRKILINPNAKGSRVLGVRVWPKAIPQFLVGHFDQLDAAKAGLANAGLKGLFLGGNYVSGVALGRRAGPKGGQEGPSPRAPCQKSKINGYKGLYRL
ncbi:unnamed protein product [Amaranthus hypochondriacus]